MARLTLIVLVIVMAGCTLIRDDIDCDAVDPYHVAREAPPLQAPAGMNVPQQRGDRRIPDLGPNAGNTVSRCLQKPPMVLSNEMQLAVREASEARKEPDRDRGVMEPWPVLQPDGWRSIDPLEGADLSEALQPGVPAWRIHDLVEDWAAAWTRQESDPYFAFYSGGFKPEGGLSWSEWRNERLREIVGAANVEVSTYGTKAQALGPDRIAVSFTERYRSDALTEVRKKEMVLVRESDVWSISRERVVQ